MTVPVLSVRNLDQGGLSRLWSKPKLEVVEPLCNAVRPRKHDDYHAK